MSDLYYASINGEVDQVTALLVEGADVHYTNEHGWTALHMACWNGHAAVVPLLLDAGAD